MNELNEAMGTLLQHYRHDFLNVLQVVGGLAQLQKTDRLLAYIRKASEEVQQFGRFIGCGDPRFALKVYDGLLQNLTGTYVLHVDGTLPLLDIDTLTDLVPALSAVQACLLNIKEYTLSVHIQGGQDPKLLLRLLGESDAATIWKHAVSTASANGLCAFYQRENCEFSLLLDKRVSQGEK